MSPTLHLVVPGPLDQRTGGYLYDARMAAGLRSRGWRVEAHELPGRFPDPDDRARTALAAALASLPEGALAVVDGLAAGLLPEVVEAHAPGLRLLALVHHPLAEETGLAPEAADRFRALERRTLAAVEGVIVTSAFTAERLRASYGVAPARLRTAVPGTEPAEPAHGPGPGEPPRLLAVGSVTPRKGHDVLVEALARLRDLAWSCACAGSLERAPDFARTVRERAGELGLTPRLRFTGELEREALDALWATGTLFVLPSWYEGYGMAFTEALARGLPVVGTTGGAIPHTVPADAGALVPPGDVDALAQALRRLLEDDRLRERRARAARAHAAALPDWDQAAGAFQEALRTLVPEEAR